MIIGCCIGETSLLEVNFVSKKMPKVGEYVSLEYDGKMVLGMIETMVRGCVSLNGEIYDPAIVKMITDIEGNDLYIKGKVRILGDINNSLRLPRTPIPPGTLIKLADKEILNSVFKVQNPIKLGTLINQEDVDVNVEANYMLNRHLAILAMTGAGKSNTVCVLIDELLKYNGAIFIFDMHSEYSNAEFGNGNVNIIKPTINPIYMSFSEIKNLANIRGNAHIQERFFRKAFNEAKNIVEKGEANTTDFLAIISSVLEGWFNDDERKTDERNKIMDVINKIEDLQERYKNLFNTNIGNILSNIKIGHVNVLDLGQSDEFAAEVLVSHILRNALKNRKDFIHDLNSNLLEFPVFFIVEEAHILAPNKRDTSSKFWISRIAREGRKFGLGLCLVSQSPKSIDHAALSQSNNMIILRLVEPEDQRHVQSASESLSKDLVKQLPSLNIGEALVIGLMTKIPTLVKINEFKGRTHGGDIDIIKELAKFKEKETREILKQEEECNNLGYDY